MLREKSCLLTEIIAFEHPNLIPATNMRLSPVQFLSLTHSGKSTWKDAASKRRPRWVRLMRMEMNDMEEREEGGGIEEEEWMEGTRRVMDPTKWLHQIGHLECNQGREAPKKPFFSLLRGNSNWIQPFPRLAPFHHSTFIIQLLPSVTVETPRAKQGKAIDQDRKALIFFPVLLFKFTSKCIF